MASAFHPTGPIEGRRDEHTDRQQHGRTDPLMTREAVRARIGMELGVSEWIGIDQN